MLWADDAYYHTKRWRKLRERVLRRDGYMCQWAKRYGKRLPATHVHHIFPRDLYPEYQWEPWNLVSLSKQGHEEMHNRLTGELSEAGLALMRRVGMSRGIKI